MDHSQDDGDARVFPGEIFDSLPYPLFFRNADLRLELRNPAAAALLGGAGAEPLGRKAEEACPDPMAEALARADGEILSGGSESAVAFFAAKDGRSYAVREFALRDGEGRLRGLFTAVDEAGALDRAKEESRRVMRLKDAILAISASALGLETGGQLFDLILEKLLAAIDHADVGCVLLLGADDRLHIASAKGYPKDGASSFSLRLEDSFQWKKSGGRLDETLIIDDLDSFLRTFDVPVDILRDEGGSRIRSSMSTPLFVDGKFRGIINLDSRASGVFDETDRFLAEYIRLQVPIVLGMHAAHERVKELLAEKTLILKEVHHRVRNNMGTVQGMLSLQAASVEDAAARAALEDAAGRVRSMMTLYDSIYGSESYADAGAADILPALVDAVLGNFAPSARIDVEKRIEDFPIGSRRLQPLCIIVNEILTNSMKYAFAGRERGTVTVVARREGGRARIELGDDGVGLPAGAGEGRAGGGDSGGAGSGGFGLMLIRSLTSQLGGEISVEREGGTRYLLSFPL